MPINSKDDEEREESHKISRMSGAAGYPLLQPFLEGDRRRLLGAMKRDLLRCAYEIEGQLYVQTIPWNSSGYHLGWAVRCWCTAYGSIYLRWILD